jgi:hypothetical protein
MSNDLLLARARTVYELLKGEAPAIGLREVLEAVLGFKCSRVSVTRGALERLDRLARELEFGIAVADSKRVSAFLPGKGMWSDQVSEYVPLDDPANGLFAVYVASTPADAQTARETEARTGDDSFGELLRIPKCCRRFYLERRPQALAAGDDYLWETLGESPGSQVRPAGANILGQYFGRCLLSHFPCSLSCAASRKESALRRQVIARVCSDFSNFLAGAHHWPVVVLRDKGMIAYPDAKVIDDCVMPRPDVERKILGQIPSELLQPDSLCMDEEGYVVVEHNNQLRRIPGADAQLIVIGREW